METRQAFLLSWFPDRGFGILQGSSSLSERYFLHVSKLDEPLDFVPQVNQKFEFEVLKPKRKDLLPQASKVKMVRQ